ncbi:MAG: hypothetical protein WAK17_06260 [Candidatus Nitrosopolaris sp.]|jgi:hypothetical protein
MNGDKDILTKEIGSWLRFGYALRNENRILFEDMLDRCKEKEYVECAAAKGENFSAEVLFLVLIFEQEKIINKLMRKLGKADRIQR